MLKVILKEDEWTYDIKEAMNALRTNLQFSGTDKRVILFTSSSAGEGKSTTVLRTARSLAEIGHRVLVIDADMRRSVLAQNFAKNKPASGLSHFLSGQCQATEAINMTSYKNVHICFAGHKPPNPTELLASKRFESLIEAARKTYDYVLIDCPPLGMVIDAATAAKYCDGVVVVIEANQVKYRFAQTVCERIAVTGCPLVGVVLNKVKKSNSRYYYSKYYGKSYGKYEKHFEQPEDKAEDFGKEEILNLDI